MASRQRDVVLLPTPLCRSLCLVCDKKTVVPPPILPVHSSALFCLDASMKWRRKHVVLTEDGLYMHGHRREGFDRPTRFKVSLGDATVH